MIATGIEDKVQSRSRKIYKRPERTSLLAAAVFAIALVGMIQAQAPQGQAPAAEVEGAGKLLLLGSRPAQNVDLHEPFSCCIAEEKQSSGRARSEWPRRSMSGWRGPSA